MRILEQMSSESDSTGSSSSSFLVYHSLARQHQNVDRAIVCRSSEGNNSQWRKMIHDVAKPYVAEEG